MPTIPSLEHCLGGIERAHILLDTNFFIDSFRSINNDGEDSPYKLFLKEATTTNTLVTIPPVSLEFFKGSDLIEDRKRKKALYDDIVSATLPIDSTVWEHADELTQVYRSNGKDLSVTDYLLGATLIRYGNSTFYLLTRDHGDFPVKIFDRERAIVFQHPRGGIDVYALFMYSSEKINGIQTDLLNIERRKK